MYRRQRPLAPDPNIWGFVRHLLHGSHSREVLVRSVRTLSQPLEARSWCGCRRGGICSELQKEGFGTWRLNSVGPEIRTCVLLSCNLAWVTASASWSGVGRGQTGGHRNISPKGQGGAYETTVKAVLGSPPMTGRCGGPAGEERALCVVCVPHLAEPNPDHPRLGGIQSPKGPCWAPRPSLLSFLCSWEPYCLSLSVPRGLPPPAAQMR